MEGNGILQSAVKQAVDKLADRGVDGCTTKDVLLATFGSLVSSGGLCSSEEARSISKDMRKFGFSVIAMCFSTLVAIILVLIFL